MSCRREGNRRFGIALAMCQRLKWFNPRTGWRCKVSETAPRQHSSLTFSWLRDVKGIWWRGGHVQDWRRPDPRSWQNRRSYDHQGRLSSHESNNIILCLFFPSWCCVSNDIMLFVKWLEWHLACNVSLIQKGICSSVVLLFKSCVFLFQLHCVFFGSIPGDRGT